MHSKFEYILALFQEGKTEKAKKECLKVLKNESDNFDILHLLGIILFNEKKFDLSIEYIQKAIKINPNNAEANNNLGIALKEINKFELSLISFQRAIKIDPNYVDAYNNLGIVCKQLNKVDDAIDSWKKAIKIEPKYIHAYNNIGNFFLETKNPKSAIKYYEKAILIDKNFFESYLNIGNALQDLGLHNEAIKNYNKAINIKSNYAEAYYNKGNSLKEMNLLEEAVLEYENAAKINIDLKYLLGNLIFTKHNLCDWRYYNKELDILKNKINDRKKASKTFTTLSIFDSPLLHKLSAETNIKDKHKNIDADKNIKIKKENKKIKLGYYSADFRNHAMSYLLIKMFEFHDKSKFEIFAFSFGPNKNDNMQKRISSTFDHFIDVRLKTDKEISKLSKELEIDIAIDLMGFTKLNRFGIFIEGCAPIQVNYLGYPGTLGSKCIDYIIGDKFLIQKENQKHYSEKIIYLPNTYQVRDCTQNISEKIFTKKDFNLPENSFIFCCFNKHHKLNPDIFEIWMRILKKINNSVLLLLEDNIKTSENLKKEAAKKGINSNRIIFVRRIPMEEHLARHKIADLFLDTYPYGAHTASSDALWTGLPIVTLTGQSFASRVAGSILTAIDIPELITQTKEEYENLILDLATNKNKLNQIKEKLSKNILTKPLFNTKLYTKNIESAYIKIYERHLKNLPVENIEIS